MPTCEKHTGDRQINCSDCFTDSELQSEIARLGEFKLPAGPGEGKKTKQRRSDDPTGKKKRGWMDELLE